MATEQGAAATGEVLAPMPTGRRFAPGYDPRRSLGRVSAQEREFRKAVEERAIPKAIGLLELLAASAEKELKAKVPKPDCTLAFFKICGLIQRPNNHAQLEALALAIVQGAVAEAQARRAAEVAVQGRLGDVGTEE